MGIKSRMKNGGTTTPPQPVSTKPLPDAFHAKPPQETDIPVGEGVVSPVASQEGETGSPSTLPADGESGTPPQEASAPAQPKPPVENAPVKAPLPFPKDRFSDEAIADTIKDWKGFDGLGKSAAGLKKIAEHIRANSVENQTLLTEANMSGVKKFLELWDPRFVNLREVVKKKQEILLKPLRDKATEVREFYKPVLEFLEPVIRDAAIIATGIEARERHLLEEAKKEEVAEQNEMGLELEQEHAQATETARGANDPDARREAQEKVAEIENKQVKVQEKKAEIEQKPVVTQAPKSGGKTIRKVKRKVASYDNWGKILAWLAVKVEAGEIDPADFIKPVAGGFTKWENENGKGSIPGFSQVEKEHHKRS